jgi:hypothetical protein
MPKIENTRRFRPLTWVLLLLLIAVAIGAWQRQWVYDQIALYNYQPPSAIAALATDSTMTDDARRVFYVNHPALQAKSTFSKSCPSNTEQTVVLGCYISGQRGIYLLDVDKQELNGIEQVTAAHEMLHAAYDRLSSNDRKRIDSLLQNYFNNGLKDETTRETINEYRSSEPDELVNEMHSIIGTQVGSLPPELEQYYTRYFKDRAALVKYYTNYESAFTTRRDQIKAFDTQLNALKKQIDTLESSLKDESASLAAQRATLDRQRESDPSTYNAAASRYNAAVNSYNANVRQARSLIDQYNQIVNQRNAIAFEERDLAQSLRSQPSVQ